MHKKIYSHSKLSTYEQCPFKYKIKYIDKVKPVIEKTIEAHLGSAVHETLEWVYNFVKENPENRLNLDEIIVKYIDTWQKDFSKDILVVKKNMTYKDYFNKGIEFLSNYFYMHSPFRDGTIECEKRIEIELDENTMLQGFIDRLVHNIEKGHFEIHDYKTANTLPTQEKMDKDRQLALYSIAIKEIYGKDKEVILIWHYLAHNQKIISKRTNEQLEELKYETKQLIKKIENSMYFPTDKSILCDWCEYREVCPAWNLNSPYSTHVEEKNSENSIENFPAIKKYIVEEKFTGENPADEPDRNFLDIF
jgi:putative RecB family exonuclease